MKQLQPDIEEKQTTAQLYTLPEASAEEFEKNETGECVICDTLYNTELYCTIHQVTL